MTASASRAIIRIRRHTAANASKTKWNRIVLAHIIRHCYRIGIWPLSIGSVIKHCGFSSAPIVLHCCRVQTDRYYGLRPMCQSISICVLEPMWISWLCFRIHRRSASAFDLYVCQCAIYGNLAIVSTPIYLACFVRCNAEASSIIYLSICVRIATAYAITIIIINVIMG